MAIATMLRTETKRFIVKRSELTTEKLFVEYYLPEYKELLAKLSRGRYPIRPLKELAVRMFDGPFGSDRRVEMYQETGIPYLRVKDVQPGGINTEALVFIPPEKHEQLSRSRVVPGDLLITIAGRLGTAAVFPASLREGNITGHIVGIELSPDVDPDYVAAFINSPLCAFQVTRLGQRTTRPELNITELGQLLIPVPNKQLQYQIAHLVRTAYASRLSKRAEATKVLRSIDYAVLQQVGISLACSEHKRRFAISVTKMAGNRFDVGPYASNFDPSKYPTIAWTALSSLADVPTNTKHPSREPKKEFNYIGMSDVDDETGEVRVQHLYGHEIAANKAEFLGNDVVFARIEPCVYNRKIALIPPDLLEAVGSTELLIARPKPGSTPGFLLWMLRSELIQQQIAGMMTVATGRRRLPNTAFAELLIPSVPPASQVQIADQAFQMRDAAKVLIEDADKIVEEAETKVAALILGETLN
jgi:type I restriction enzyme, S subunit